MRSLALAAAVVVAAAGTARADGSAAGSAAASPSGSASDGASDTASDSGRESKGVFGLGLVLGEPTGLCAKLYLADDRAIAAAIGSAFIGGGFQASADFLFHPYILTKRDEFVVPFYLGPGIRAIDYRKSGDNSYGALGIRAVAGFLFDFKKGIPIDAFAEAAFVLEYGFGKDHGVAAAVNGGIGARYYF